jgi:hypothetical protein
MSDFTKISLEHGARLHSRQLELLMAMQIRLAESQAKRMMGFWTELFFRQYGPGAVAHRPHDVAGHGVAHDEREQHEGGARGDHRQRNHAR